MKTKLTVLFVLLLLCSVQLTGQGHGDFFSICTEPGMQDYIQAAYNPLADEFLVVWEDNRHADTTETDIWGQFVSGDGVLRDTNFVICNADRYQYWPRLDFDPTLERYLVVFEDGRIDSTRGDVRGVFVNADGTLLDAPTSEDDHSFYISDNEAHIYTCSVAFNFLENKYLVVWGDARNETGTWPGDVYGQVVAADGTLLPPPDPAASDLNFPIFSDTTVGENVADVTYNVITNEWFVVCGTDSGYVLGQRVDKDGSLVSADGQVIPTESIVIAKETMEVPWWFPGMKISRKFNNGPDCLQARVQASNETPAVMIAKDNAILWTECEVIWKGVIDDLPDNDVYGQRIGFFWDNDVWIAQYVDLAGNTKVDTISNHTISIQGGRPYPPEIAYSEYDNEFLVAWGNPESDQMVWPNPHNLWGQRLWVDTQNNQNMIYLADNRIDTVTFNENILYASTDNHEGGQLGVAHSSHQNKFLIAYAFEDTAASSGRDVYGFMVNGSEPTCVDCDPTTLVKSLKLNQNFPNPFNPATEIEYSIPARENVSVSIYDITGRKIRTLVDESQSAGSYTIRWNGLNDQNRQVASGIYMYQLKYGNKVLTKKMSLIR